jgi:hypothetical protein
VQVVPSARALLLVRVLLLHLLLCMRMQLLLMFHELVAGGLIQAPQTAFVFLGLGRGLCVSFG